MKISNILILLVLLSIPVIAIQSCNKAISGEGDTVIRDRSISKTFTGVSLSIDADVFVTQGSESKITIHGQENIINNIDLDVNGNTLDIGFNKNARDYDKLKIYITTAALEKLNISGSGSITAADNVSTTNMDVNISGSGDIFVNKLNASSSVEANISGSGNITLAGVTNNTDYNISGSGSIHAFDLPCKNSTVHISGSGDVETNVTDKLDAHISGSGDIFYKGRPVVNTNISGDGKVQHVE
jgi:hypothetical protein